MKMIEWDGGEMPVPEGTPIKVKHRDGTVVEARAGDMHSNDWRHGVDSVFRECAGDIVAYAVLEPDPAVTPVEPLTQWEYTLEVMPRGTVAEIRGYLNRYGADGWELCLADFGHLIFKRSKS
jgi:hypothetical protein